VDVENQKVSSTDIPLDSAGVRFVSGNGTKNNTTPTLPTREGEKQRVSSVTSSLENSDIRFVSGNESKSVEKPVINNVAQNEISSKVTVNNDKNTVPGFF